MKMELLCRASSPSKRFLDDRSLGNIQFIHDRGDVIFVVNDDSDLIEKLFHYRTGYRSLSVYPRISFNLTEESQITSFEMRPNHCLDLSEAQHDAARNEMFRRSQEVKVGNYGLIRIIDSLSLGTLAQPINRGIYSIIDTAGDFVAADPQILDLFGKHCRLIEVGVDSVGRDVMLVSPDKILPSLHYDDSVTLEDGMFDQRGFLAYEKDIGSFPIARMADPVRFISHVPFPVVNRKFRDSLVSLWQRETFATFIPVLQTATAVYEEYHRRFHRLIEVHQYSGKGKRIHISQETIVGEMGVI